ncbi:MAG TPA: hypothetical protein VML55_00505 [Planctomycetaceae bacterium]|nr:hypothetical protein [Planctomycetaceae bacterium]
MDQDELALYVIERLGEVGIAYMVVGSYASNMYGEPRATNDIDIVVAARFPQIEQLAARLDDDKYLSLQAARDALLNQSLFSVIDTKSGWKVDLIPRKRRPFDHASFHRRLAGRLLDREICVLSPEDAILSKLEWAKKSDSERQLRDVESMLVLQWEKIDFEYLRTWAPELSVTGLLEQVVEDVRQLKGRGF